MPAVLDAARRALSERHEVTVATAPGPEPWEFDAIADLERAGADIRWTPRHMELGLGRWKRRFRLTTRWLQGREPWRTTWFHEPSLQVEVDAVCSAQSFDFIIVEDNSMATFRLPSDIPRVLTEYEVRRPRALDWRGSPVQELDWRRWYKYQRRVWSRFDAVQFFTERDVVSATEIAPEISDRFHANPFGIVLPSIDVGVSPLQNVVGFIGNFSHPPNVDAALWLAREIMPLVRERVAGAQLRVAGTHAPSEVASPSQPGVTFVGFQNDADAFLRRCAVVAAPVRTGGGMRMKVLHAMALGAAVVTTDRGIEGIRVGGQHPPVIVANGAADIAEAIVGLLEEPARREELGQQARAHVEEYFSVPAYGRRLNRVLEAARQRFERTTENRR
jgi:glycosyltransferase involved in cell wall biosynthesis